MLMEDFNISLMLHLHKKSTIETTFLPNSDSSSLALCMLFSHYSLIDAWRQTHPMKQDYSNFSQPHQVVGRAKDLVMRKNDTQRPKESGTVITWLCFRWAARKYLT